MPRAPRHRDLAGLVAGWAGAVALWGSAVGLAFAHLNGLGSGELVVLIGFWCAVYLALSLPILAAVAVAGRAHRALGHGPGRSAFFGASSAALFILCLNAVCRWTPLYKALSPRTAQLVPVAALELVVLLLAPPLVLMGLARLAAGRDRRRAAAWIGAGLALLAGAHAVNLRYERPSRVDLAERVAPLVEPPADCRSGSVPAEGLLFLAIDGFTWNVAAALLEQGQLPHFARLLSRGAYGHLDPLYPSYSPVVWTTMATGRTEAEHRIHGFLQFHVPGVPTPLARGPRLNSFTWWGGANSILFVLVRIGLVDVEGLASTRRRGHAIWEVASANGYSVGVYDWMNTLPVNPVEGYIFSRNGSPPANASPAETVHRILRGVPWRNRIEHPELADGRRRFEEAFALYRAFRPRVSFHFNKTVDIVHDRWAEGAGYLVQPLRRPYREFHPDIVRAYELTDDWIGRFVDAAPPGFAIALASDHGFEFNGTHHVYSPPGVIVLSGGPFACGRLLEGASVYDVAPTLLAVLDLPGTVAMQGRVLREALAPEHREVALTRLEDYPAVWRRDPLAPRPGRDEDWDDLVARLRAMGYAN